jgi:metal-responsive CopG/Arc/MetJ family transcriptional regulator
MTLDDDLVKTVDRVAKTMHTTRSAFTRTALRQAIRGLEVQKLEERHRTGYMRKPVEKDEFGVWESQQSWGAE